MTRPLIAKIFPIAAMIILALLSLTCRAFPATCSDGQEFKWTDIKELTQIGAKRATLKTGWKNGKMNFVIRLEDFPKESAQCRDVQLQFVDKNQPILGFHIGFHPYHNLRYFQCERINEVVDERTQMCEGSINVDESTYRHMIQSGQWEIGLAKQHYRFYGLEGDKDFGVAIIYYPRQWYGTHANNSDRMETANICQCRIIRWTDSSHILYADPVWFRTMAEVLAVKPADWSTEASISFCDSTHLVLIPTIFDGKLHSSEEAIEHYQITGEHLGKFDYAAEATGNFEKSDAYAETIHRRPQYVDGKPLQ